MKKVNSIWPFACGTLLGLLIALCLGAGTKTNSPPKATTAVATTDAPKIQWAHIKLVSYPNGGTGFFDEETGTVYVYDSALRNCYLIRQLRVLGDRMQ